MVGKSDGIIDTDGFIDGTSDGNSDDNADGWIDGVPDGSIVGDSVGGLVLSFLAFNSRAPGAEAEEAPAVGEERLG